MLAQNVRVILTVAAFFVLISSQKIPNSSRNCFPLNSRRGLPCPPGYEAQPLSQPPPAPNILERRLFIRKLRNPIIPERVQCCRISVSTPEDDDSEKLASPQIQFPDNIRKPSRQRQQRRRRRRRRRKPRTRFGAIINKLGDSVDEFLNTSLTYRQHDGWTWTFRPFKILPFSGEEEVFEKFRTRRRRNRGRNFASSRLPRPPPLRNDIDVENINDIHSPHPASLSTPPPTPPPPPPPPPSLPPPSPLPKPIKLIKQEEPIISSSVSLSPYIISLRRNGIHFCSGVVLDSKHILTAANCFVSPVPGNPLETIVNVDPDGIKVKVEGYDEDFIVDHICVHNSVPNPTKELNEISVLTLAQALVFTGDLYPAKLVWEGKGMDLDRIDNKARWFSPSEKTDTESTLTKLVAPRICRSRHRFFLRKEEFCVQIGGRHGKLCSKSEFLGGALECPSGLREQSHVCGIIAETSCPPLGTQHKNNPVTKVSPIPKWVYPILSSNSYRSCF